MFDRERNEAFGAKGGQVNHLPPAYTIGSAKVLLDPLSTPRIHKAERSTAMAILP